MRFAFSPTKQPEGRGVSTRASLFFVFFFFFPPAPLSKQIRAGWKGVSSWQWNLIFPPTLSRNHPSCASQPGSASEAPGEGAQWMPTLPARWRGVRPFCLGAPRSGRLRSSLSALHLSCAKLAGGALELFLPISQPRRSVPKAPGAGPGRSGQTGRELSGCSEPPVASLPSSRGDGFSQSPGPPASRRPLPSEEGPDAAGAAGEAAAERSERRPEDAEQRGSRPGRRALGASTVSSSGPLAGNASHFPRAFLGGLQGTHAWVVLDVR